jgi:hypothetical protein
MKLLGISQIREMEDNLSDSFWNMMSHFIWDEIVFKMIREVQLKIWSKMYPI